MSLTLKAMSDEDPAYLFLIYVELTSNLSKKIDLVTQSPSHEIFAKSILLLHSYFRCFHEIFGKDCKTMLYDVDSTVWKFKDFSATQILREITFSVSRSS